MVGVTYRVPAYITIEGNNEVETRKLLMKKLTEQQDDVDYNGMALHIPEPMNECDVDVHLIEGPED